MFFLMLDPRFKTPRLVSSLIGREQGKAIAKEYDRKSLFLMLLKYYYHVYPLVESERGVVDQKVEEGRGLDIFEMTTNISKPITELVNRELLILKELSKGTKLWSYKF